MTCINYTGIAPEAGLLFRMHSTFWPMVSPATLEKVSWDHILGRIGRLNPGDNLVKGKKGHCLKLVQDCSASVSSWKVTQWGDMWALILLTFSAKQVMHFSQPSDEALGPVNLATFKIELTVLKQIHCLLKWLEMISGKTASSWSV